MQKKFLLCVNAANIEKDYQWLLQNKQEEEELKIDNQSQQWSQLAIQGPTSLEVLKGFFFLRKSLN